MITRLLIAGVAIGALAAGGASAHVRHHHRRAHSSGYSYAEPAQPIPYAEVDHYLRSSPRERRAIEMAAANTGGMANTSASVEPPAAAAATSTTSPGADTSVPASEGANPTTGVTATPTPNNPSDQVPSTGPDVQGNPVATPPPNPNPQPQ